MKEVLAKIKPSQKEQQQFQKTTESFLKKLNSKLKDAEAMLGGSGAKGTWLSGNYDVDIFVKYNFQTYKEKSQELSELLEKALKEAFPKTKIERLHGSRDYFQLSYENLCFEVVPILNISKAEDALNITDISPLHAQWVNNKGKNLKDEIMLAKQFCRANNLYGAESYIGGFSGYVLEILIVHYGSFQKLLNASQKWKEKEIIDVEQQYQKANVFFELNKSKLQSPLIIIDPVDKSRNAAAALTKEKFVLFKQAAKQYLQKSSPSFFEKKELNLEKLKEGAKKKKQQLIILDITPVEGKEDVVGGKLLKVFEFVKKELQLFILLKSGWQWNKKEKAIMYFLTEKKELPEYEIRMGPPVKLKQFAADFKKKNKNTYEEKGRLMAKVKREFPFLDQYVQNLIKNKYVQEKVKSITILDNL